VDLPTYTNIWRIEKRLYKLYDFRLPMPLPINWIAVFAGITIPYIILLIAIGLPFNHTLVWLYVLPPGVLTWLTTRPVIENKRLPELVESQSRYLMEPRTWVRLTPLSEKDQMVLTARVWHSRPARRPARQASAPRPASAARQAYPSRSAPSRAALPMAEPARGPMPMQAGPVLKPTSVFRPDPAGAQGQAARQRQAASAQQRPPVGERPVAERSLEQEQSRVQERSRATAAGRGTARRAPVLPGARPLPPVTPVVAAESSGLPAGLFGPVLGPGGLPGRRRQDDAPVHAMPDVVPSTAASPPPSPVQPSSPAQPPAPPTAPASPLAASGRSATAATSPRAQPPRPARVVVPAPPGKPDQPPVRIRATAAGGASLELSHDGPGRRPVAPRQPAEPGAPADAPVWPTQPLHVSAPPASSAPPPGPANGPAPGPANGWPAAARPLRPVPPTAGVTAPPAGESKFADGIAAAPAAPAPVETGREPATPVEAVPVEAVPVEAVPVEAVPVEAVPVEALQQTAQEASAAPQEPRQAPSAAFAQAAATPDSPAVPSFTAAPAPLTAAPAPVQPRGAAAPQPAPAPPPAVKQVSDPKQAVPSIERALSAPGRDRNAAWGGKVKLVTGNGAAQGPGARDQEAQDRNRARLPLADPRRILVLGCTSGAGQSVTAYMTAFMLASLREQAVAAVDLHDGALARFRAPAAWLEELLAGKPPQQVGSARPDGLHPSPRPNPARLDVVASHEPLRDGDEIKLAVQLNRHYPLTVLDPGAAGLARLLKVTDQLVVVVPANGDAAGALADTRDWLDNNGHAELAMQSVTVINGVSRRSLPDVELAESVARGRSRAIVRVPWDEMLPVADAGPSSLRPQTRVAYTALSGVLVAGLAALPGRKRQ
jgi:TcpE family